MQDGQLLYEVFDRARALQPSIRKKNKPYLDAIYDEIGRRKLLTVKNIGYLIGQSRLFFQRTGINYAQVIHSSGPPDSIEKLNNNITKIQYNNTFSFVDIYTAQKKHVKYYLNLSLCFRREKMFDSSWEFKFRHNKGFFRNNDC